MIKDNSQAHDISKVLIILTSSSYIKGVILWSVLNAAKFKRKPNPQWITKDTIKQYH